MVNIPSAGLCQDFCSWFDGSSPCNYFVYNGDQQNCKFYSSSNRTCVLIRGPQSPSVEQCYEKPGGKLLYP